MESTSVNANVTAYENKEIEKLLEGKYIKIKDGETRVLQFTPERTQIVERKDFDGKPVKKVEFIAFDVNDPEMKEKSFELSTIHAGKIYDQLKKAKSVLEVSRSGSGKDTRYFVKAVK